MVTENCFMIFYSYWTEAYSKNKNAYWWFYDRHYWHYRLYDLSNTWGGDKVDLFEDIKNGRYNFLMLFEVSKSVKSSQQTPSSSLPLKNKLTFIWNISIMRWFAATRHLDFWYVMFQCSYRNISSKANQ